MEQAVVLSVSGAIAARLARPVRVLHVAAGNFSSSLQLALELCQAARVSGSGMRATLALRPVANTDGARLHALRDKGLRLRLLGGRSRLHGLFKLWQLWREQRVDVVVVHDLQAQLWEACLLALCGARKLVLVEQQPGQASSLWRQWLGRQLARRASLLVATSEAQRARLIHLSGRSERCVAIAPGVDLRRYVAAEELRYEQRTAGIVMAARFGAHDHACLIQALGLLAQRGLRLPLLLTTAGRGRSREAAQALIEQLGLQGQVRFIAQAGELPTQLMKHAIYVHASRHEGTPQALLEAMAAGCACIASAVGGAAEVIDAGRTGLLVPPGDAAALADAIERLISEPAQAAGLAAAARQRALQAHGLSLMRLRYQALLTQL